MEEIWKDIEGYEGLYQVSNLGNVRSLNYRHKRKTRILRPCSTQDGYLLVCLHKNGKHKTHKVHRLVAEAFILNPLGLPEVNHIDEDKTNNRVDNLEFCDRDYNQNYGTRNERMGRAQINHPTKSKPVRCVETGEVYPSANEAARRTGIDRGNLASACRKVPNHQTAGGFHWEYVTNSPLQ